MELPGLDTPKTPVTPTSPADITIQRGGGEPTEFISFSDCQELAKAVKFCSRSLVEVNWVEIPDVRGGKPRFIPDNFESAKAFLRASVEVIPSAARLTKSSLDTPVTSHPRRASEMGVCHGCHGPIGGGAHQGSAPGKGICSHQHSHFCKGGIVENDSWAPCPLSYLYNPDLDLASGPGFESTLHTFNFRAGSQQNGPSSSTPVVGTEQDPDSNANQNMPPGFQQQVIPPPHGNPQSATSFQSTADRFPGVREGRQLGSVFSDPDTRVPGMVNMPMGAVGGASPAYQVHGVPENVQYRIDSHRAENQSERIVSDRPQGDVDITHLRNNPQLRSGVENLVEGFIRQRIPSLSAARTVCAGTILYSQSAADL